VACAVWEVNQLRPYARHWKKPGLWCSKRRLPLATDDEQIGNVIGGRVFRVANRSGQPGAALSEKGCFATASGLRGGRRRSRHRPHDPGPSTFIEAYVPRAVQMTTALHDAPDPLRQRRAGPPLGLELYELFLEAM